MVADTSVAALAMFQHVGLAVLLPTSLVKKIVRFKPTRTAAGRESRSIRLLELATPTNNQSNSSYFKLL